VLIPKANSQDVMIDDKFKDMIEVLTVDSLDEVMEHALVTSDNKPGLVERLGKIIDKLTPPSSDGSLAL